MCYKVTLLVPVQVGGSTHYTLILRKTSSHRNYVNTKTLEQDMVLQPNAFCLSKYSMQAFRKVVSRVMIVYQCVCVCAYMCECMYIVMNEKIIFRSFLISLVLQVKMEKKNLCWSCDCLRHRQDDFGALWVKYKHYCCPHGELVRAGRCSAAG